MGRRPRGTHLADELIEALRVELLAHGADPGLARLALQQTLVELLLQVDHVQARGWRARHVLNPELPVLGPLPAREGVHSAELLDASKAIGSRLGPN